MKNKILTAILSFSLILTMMPFNVFAQKNEECVKTLPNAIENNKNEYIPQIEGFSCWAINMIKTKIVWQRSSNPNVEYWLYRGDRTYGDWGEPIAKLSNDTTSYIDYPTAEESDYWFYMLRPVLKVGQSTIFGEYSNMDYAHLQVIDMNGFNVHALNANSVKISWEESSDPSNDYYIYRGTKPYGDYGAPIATLCNNETQYIDKDVECGTKYYYIARQVTEDGGGHYYFGNYTSLEYGYPRVNEPTNLEAWSSDSVSANVSWTKSMSDNVEYWLYRGTAPTGDWGSPIAKLDKDTTYYKDTDVVVGQKNYYMVKAVEKINGKNYSSEYSNKDYAWPRKTNAIMTLTPNIEIPDITGFETYALGRDSVQVEWDKSPNPDVEYWLYRGTSPTGDWGGPIAKFDNGTVTFLDKNVEMGKKYYYMMRGAVKTLEGWDFGEYTNIDYAFPRISDIQGFDAYASNAITANVVWDKSKESDVQYWIYSNTAPTGDFGSPVAKLSNDETTFVDKKGSNNNKVIYYIARPVVMKDGKYYFGEYTQLEYAYPRVPTPTGFHAWSNLRVCYQEWDPSPLNDIQHWIYKSEVPYGDWGIPYAQLDNEYTYIKDDDVIRGHTYYYMMRDIEVVDGVTYFSEYSPMDWAKPHTPI